MVLVYCRHCIVATGITCTSCDSDADDAVPLQKDDEPTTSSVASAVGSDSLPLDKSEDTTGSGGYFQTGFYKDTSGSSQLSSPYQTGYQQQYQGGFLNNYQGAGYSGSYNGYSAYSSGYSGFSSNLYNSGGFGVRSFRRARGGGRSPGSRPMFLTVGKDLKTKTPLMEFLPAIKGIEKDVEYFIAAGNATLFEVLQKGRLGYLHALEPLAEGSYSLRISSKLKNEEKVDAEAKSWFHKKKFNLKLVMKVV